MSDVSHSQAVRRLWLARSTSGQASSAMQLFETMLWALRGATASSWVVHEHESAADVIVADAADTRIPMWQAGGKPLIRLLGVQSGTPTAEEVLVHPFQLSHVIKVLGVVEKRLPSATGKSETLIEVLRRAGNVAASTSWCSWRSGGKDMLWVSKAAYAAEPNARLNLRDASSTLGALEMGAVMDRPPAAGERRPLVELRWWVGLWHSATLAAWLDPVTAYRVTRWPDFGVIRPFHQHIRATALMSAWPYNVDKLSEHARLPREEAIRLLNALSTCGVLTPSKSRANETVQAQPSPIIRSEPVNSAALQSAGGVRSLLSRVRLRLGIPG
jgi:hypothetical protein